jgi:hypothetical protein
MEAAMKRIIFVLGALLIPVLAAHMVLAAGLFKVGEKAPSFALTASPVRLWGWIPIKGRLWYSDCFTSATLV